MAKNYENNTQVDYNDIVIIFKAISEQGTTERETVKMPTHSPEGIGKDSQVTR